MADQLVEIIHKGRVVGWVRQSDGSGLTPYYRTVLTGPEWVDTWTADEWRQLKTARNGTTAAAKALDKFMDAIQLTNSLDLHGPRATQFYDWLVANGYITAQRRTELTQGILESP